jgi:hypothetical protein
MGECECLTKCPFFNDQMTHMLVPAGQLKTRYCLRDWDTCARFRVFKALGPGRAPADLYPTQLDRVTEILAAAS